MSPATPLLSVIMPFHNEEATLTDVVSRVLRVKLPIAMELILVDDGSTDASVERISEFLKDRRVTCFRNVHRMGKGAAVNRGIRESHGTILLVQDADLEYRPEEYAKLLAPILTGERSFVLGSRVLGARSWRVRLIAGRPFYSLALNLGAGFLSRVVNLFYGSSLTDPATMMKLFRRDCLRRVELESEGFDWDWELVCKFLRQGFVPLEIPIAYQARAPREGKKLRMWRDGWSALYAILRYRFGERKSSFAESGTSNESIT